MAGSVSLASCDREEDELVATPDVTICRFSPFPQGDGEYDQKIEDFYKAHEVYIIYKDIDTTDVNKGWNLDPWGEKYQVTAINPEEVGFYYDFYEENLFSRFPDRYLRFLPMYLYMVESLESTYNVLNYRTDGFDYYCIAGTPEELEADERRIRQCLTSALLEKLIDLDTITIPVEFTAGIDYSAGVNTYDETASNYFPKLGFVANVSYDFSYESVPYSWDEEGDFLCYVRSAMAYTEEEFFEKYPADTYPLVKQRYELIIQYMKESYGIDLQGIAAY